MTTFQIEDLTFLEIGWIEVSEKDFKIKYANEFFCRLVSDKALIQKSINDYIHGFEANIPFKLWKEAQLVNGMIIQYQLFSKEASQLQLIIRTSGHFAIQNEQELRLKAIIKTAVDGIITISDKGIVESINPAAVRLFGYESFEVVGQNISLLMPEPTRSQHDSYIENYHQSHQRKVIGIGREVTARKKDGTLFPVQLGVSEVRFKDKVIFTGIIRDLTKEKAAEQQLKTFAGELQNTIDALRKKEEELYLLNTDLELVVNERTAALAKAHEDLKKALEAERGLSELKSRFVSMASHEFKTPLTSILSSASLLERYNDTDQQERRDKHIQRIKQSVQNLTNILNEFLSLEKIDSGRVDIHQDHIFLNEMMEQIREEFVPLLHPNQKIKVELAETCEIISDSHLLKNIMINLISNAIKYSMEGKDITVRVIELQEEIQIEVEDQGIGIPDEDKKHMFERFFRAANVLNIQGTGLGLTIVKRYVDLLKGDISFDSTLEKGTTFRVKLPR